MKNTEDKKALIQTAISDCTLAVNNLLNQPAVPEEKKLKNSIEFIAGEITRLELPAEDQVDLWLKIIKSVIAPQLTQEKPEEDLEKILEQKLEQKCSQCLENNSGFSLTQQAQKPRGCEGMYA